MIFLQKKLNSIIEKVLVDKSVCCHVCGKQVKHRDEKGGTNYRYFRSFDTSRLVRQFYSDISIRKVTTSNGDNVASGILIENISTGEVMPVLFSHRYFLTKFKYRKNQDNGPFATELDLIRSIMSTLNEEQLNVFIQNLFIDMKAGLTHQLTLKKNIMKKLPVDKFEEFEEFIRSSNSSKVELHMKPMSPSNLDLFADKTVNQQYKNKILYFITTTLLLWSKNWADTNYGKIKRACVDCQLLKIEKMQGWATDTLESLEKFSSMDINEKPKVLK